MYKIENTASVTIALKVRKQVQGVRALINEHETQTTESITPEERTKGNERYREDGGGEGGDRVQVSVMRCRSASNGDRYGG
jgi:hypothetical protein